MSKHNVVRASLVLGAVLTISGAAFARRPPALEAQQEAASRVFASCPELPSGPGYRDMLVRLPNAAPGAPAASVASIASAAHLTQRKMGDHMVLVCPAGTLHTTGGYRDIFLRYKFDDAKPLIASAGDRVRSR